MLAGLRIQKRSSFPGRTGLTGVVLAMGMALALPVQASDICDALHAQLNSRPTSIIGNTAQVRQYANALTQQNIAIRRIKNDQRRYGCSSGSIVIYGNPNGQLCEEISDALADAQAQRDEIAEDRDRMLMTENNDQMDDRRDRIMAALDAEGCFDEAGPNSALPDPSHDPYADRQTRGYTDPLNDDIGVDPRRDYAPSTEMPMQGGLRTLCVRTCDGAFFPISSDATPMDFRAQAAQCERMCPGTETELFYHAMVGQESSDMVSAKTGRPYTEMPTAFAYRNGSAANRSPSCSCNMAAYHNEMKKQEEQAHAPQSSAIEPYSGITKIPPSKTDTPPKTPVPETQAKAEPVPDRDYDPKNGRVRVVGPQFLPQENSRIDLKNPALKGLQPQQE